MIAGSQLRDTQGEMLSVEGADISELEAGKGRLNDNHGKGFFNSIGAVTGAKKIFKQEDCEDDRQKYYWNKVKAPFIYVKGYLYDDEDHPNAKAAAAILRNIHKNDAPLQLKASVEGGVVARGVSDSTLLARTKIHSVALTFTPANKNTLVEPLSLDKTSYNEEEDARLIQSVMHLVKKDVPSFRHIVRDSKAQKIEDNISKIVDLCKTMGIEVDIPNMDKQSILQGAIEDKIKENIILIHSAIVEGGDLDKGLKEWGLATALGAGLATASPSEAKMPKPNIAANKPAVASIQKKPVLGSMVSRNNDSRPHEQMYRQVAPTDRLLAAIGCQESTCGRFHDNHKTIKAKGAEYGHTAGGIWAMMPNTAATTLKSDPALAAKYPELAKEAKNVGTSGFQHWKFTNTLNQNPQAAADFATSEINRRRKIFNNDESKIIASWIMGVQGAINHYNTYGNFKNHQYSAEVKEKLQDIMNERSTAGEKKSKPETKKAKKSKKPKPKPKPSIKKPEEKNQIQTQPLLLSEKDNSDDQLGLGIEKALMAGYGGAGAPMSRTGGAVLQSESPSKSLKYITCDKCGKEQVHSKYQVRCRHCNDNFSLKKLNDILG